MTNIFDSKNLSSKKSLQDYINFCSDIFLGKEKVIKLALTCILAKGHLLIEDIPGVGKTTLVNLLAKTLGLPMNRIQLTSDLLPSDILGSMIYNSQEGHFVVFKGPIFSNLILADELNRATPKTQSAFLQAMEERKISIDDKTFDLPEPFLVFATQNPKHLIGTFLLPESQLDRFLMRIEIGFPEERYEMELLNGKRRKDIIDELDSFYTADQVIEMQKDVENVFVSNAIISYVERILHASRKASQRESDQGYELSGLSPRAGMAIVDAAKAYAFIENRKLVLPEDVQAIVLEVISHRMIYQNSRYLGKNIIKEMIDSIEVN